MTTVIPNHPNDRRLYPDAGWADLAIRAADDAGELRKFRAKYAGRCCACWGNVRVGQPVVGVSKGKIACAPCLYASTSKTWREV